MKKILFLFLFFAFRLSSFAGNVAGGDLNIRCLGGMTHEFTVTMWGINSAPTDTLHISFGNSNSLSVSNQDAVSYLNIGPPYQPYIQIKWVFVYTYSGPGNYPVTVNYMNRIAGCVNIPSSNNTILALTANLSVDPNIGCNSSPVLSHNNLIELIDVSTNNTFNLGAVDPDGDSLSFLFSPCLDTAGMIAGYTYPDFLGGGILNLDPVTGDYSWNPQFQGDYSIDFTFEQWKLFPNNQRYLIGTTMREVLFRVGVFSGIQDQNTTAFSIFPNPASHSQDVTINIAKDGKYTLQLLTVEGKLIADNSSFYTSGQKIILPALTSGIYFVKMADDQGEIHLTKLIVH